MTSVLAHQGGWDEILLVLAPVGLFAFLLFLANKRAARLVDLDGDVDVVDDDPNADADPPADPDDGGASATRPG
jgi:hypothetical protein